MGVAGTGGCGRDRWVWRGQVGVAGTGGCGGDRWVGVPAG